MSRMLTLSIRQPWAWLIVNGYKDVENRTWSTKIRGPVQIHAGKKFDRAGYSWIRENFPEIPMPGQKDFQCGGIVGHVTITNCAEHVESPWFFGPIGFTLEEGKPVDFIPCNGRLGFFKL